MSKWLQNISTSDGSMPSMWFRGGVSNTEASFTLTGASGYVYGSAGSAICMMSFCPIDNGNLTDIVFRPKQFNGTWSNTDQKINYEIREGLAATRRPGNILTCTGDVQLSGAVEWVNKTGISQSLTAGKIYSLVLYDADVTNGANNVSVVFRLGTSISTYHSCVSAEAGTTVNGFSTSYNVSGGNPACALKVGNRWYAGQCQDYLNTEPGSSKLRGNRFKVTENCTIIGHIVGSSDGDMLYLPYKFKLFDDSTTAGGTPLYTFTPSATSNQNGSTHTPVATYYTESQHYDIQKDTWYRFVVDPNPYDVANTRPRKSAITISGDTSTLLSAFVALSGSCYWTESTTGATSWTNSITAMALVSPLFAPKTQPTGGTGSSTHAFGFVG
jgi:hypothetical protein